MSSILYHVLQDKSQTNAALSHFQSISQQSNQREVHRTCYISNTIWQKVQNSIPQPHQLSLLDPWKIVKDVFFGENGTFVKSWSKTTVIISHLESLLSSSRDLSVRGSYFSNRYPGQVFVKVRGAQKQMPTSCCTVRWYCILLQRSHCHINWFCGDMKYHFDIWLCIFQVQPIWDIFLPSIDYYKTIWVIFLLYTLIIAKQSATLHHNSIRSAGPIG